MAEPRVLLIGGGGHCLACIDVIEEAGQLGIAGIVDSRKSTAGTTIHGFRVLGTDADLPILRGNYDRALITIGQIENALTRIKLFAALKELDYTLPAVISPLAYVSSQATVAEGTIIMHDAVVNAGAVVGANCILNTKSLVEHNARIGDHTHVSTAAVVNGGCSIGAGSFIGSQAVVVHGIELPNDRFVRAGALVKSCADSRPVRDV